jgi:hypothetical protein
MLVAERDEGSVAYDIVDERPHRDIDSEGLLLIALERHGVTRVEIDAPSIQAQPLASNCERIWKHRGMEVTQYRSVQLTWRASYDPIRSADTGTVILIAPAA